MMMLAGPYWLASGSPRRRLMLDEAGLSIKVQPADIDDGRLRPGRISPEVWDMALAYLKARRVAEMIQARDASVRSGTVIGADTVCDHDGAILGQPRNADHARWMIQQMRDRTHHTVTGVALLTLPLQIVGGSPRLLFFDRTRVTVGHVGDDEIERYVQSGKWRGKAGAYNLSERIADGWPIRVEGDADTVMGLPMQRLMPLLSRETEATR